MNAQEATQARQISRILELSEHVKSLLTELGWMIEQRNQGEIWNYVSEGIPNLNVAIAEQINMIYEASVKLAWQAKR